MSRYAVYERPSRRPAERVLGEDAPVAEVETYYDAYWEAYDIACRGLDSLVLDRSTGRVTEGWELEKPTETVYEVFSVPAASPGTRGSAFRFDREEDARSAFNREVVDAAEGGARDVSLFKVQRDRETGEILSHEILETAGVGTGRTPRRQG